MSDFIPRLALQWDFSSAPAQPAIVAELFGDNGGGLTLSQRHMDTILHVQTSGARTAIILGSPVVGGRVDRKKAAQRLLDERESASALKSLNGEFMAILWDHDKKELICATDRFSSYPVFFAQNKQTFCLSYTYLDLAKHCRDWDGFALRPEKAYEFFMLQRLMGEDTHDTVTQSLAPASMMRIQGGQAPEITPYWTMDYTKDTRSSKRALVNQFSDMFGASVQARLGDEGQTTGIFLSGGHDSRLVAAYAKTKATCYTLSFHDNLEVECARRIAKTAGHDHTFSKLGEDFFDQSVDASTQVSGGMYTTDHSLFLPIGINPVPSADVFLHGHALDFMYQGMYLHAKYYEIFNRHTYLKRFVPLPDDAANHFIHSISFRLKYDARASFIDTDAAAPLEEALYARVSDVFERGRALSDDPMDQWEYLISHTPSKHYTFSNVLSKRTYGELRTPSFDNDLYDFYLSLPHKYRLHADMLRGALYRKSPEIARIIAANHALPAGWGPYAKSALVITRKLLRHATLNKFFHVPDGKDRTWPNRDDYFRDHPEYTARSLSPLQDEGFREFLSFIDWAALESGHERLLTEAFGGAFLVTLMSYYEFYKQVMR